METGVSVFLSPTQIENHAAARARCSLTAGLDVALMKSSRMLAQGTQIIATGASVLIVSVKFPALNRIMSLAAPSV